MGWVVLFPGQGAQKVGMTKTWWDNYRQETEEIMGKASEICGVDLLRLTLEGPEEELNLTFNAQPAILATSLLTWQLWQKEFSPAVDAVAGHSLGEYSALFAAGVFSFEDGLHLVDIRGKAMEAAGEQNPGAMAAILKLDREKIEEACQRASDYGRVQIANINSPGQIVISGEFEAVQVAMKIAKELGASRVIQLDVSGAFHSHLMAQARKELEKVIYDIPFHTPQIPVYCNVNAKIVTTPDEIRKNLIDQLENPVLFVDEINQMILDGFEQFVEVGPGQVLQGLIHRINPDVVVKEVSSYPDLQNLLGDLSELENEN